MVDGKEAELDQAVLNWGRRDKSGAVAVPSSVLDGTVLAVQIFAE